MLIRATSDLRRDRIFGGGARGTPPQGPAAAGQASSQTCSANW
jgi:hypothetical protein